MTGVSTDQQPFACISVNATPVICDPRYIGAHCQLYLFQHARLLRGSRHAGLQCSASVSPLFVNGFCRTNYLNIYLADFRQIFSIGRTMALELSLKLLGTLPWQPVVDGFIHTTAFRDIQ